jgi:GMP synthase PP-ATPase subunit
VTSSSSPGPALTIRAGLQVQEERLAAVRQARTLAELEAVNRRFSAYAVLAADPSFASVLLEFPLQKGAPHA